MRLGLILLKSMPVVIVSAGYLGNRLFAIHAHAIPAYLIP
jgi:hypothetical protein